MKILYIEKMDKLKILHKIRIKQDNCEVYLDLDKEKNINKLISRILKNKIGCVVLSKELIDNKELVNALNASNINIFDGRWLEKYLSILILDYIVFQKKLKKEETEVALTVNQISDFTIEIIKILARQYKKLTVVTNHIEKLRKVEKEIYDKEGILIVLSNNHKKSLIKSQLILNIDFCKEVLNRYRINENATIVNLEGDIKIEEKRFQGINVNDYEIEIGREELIWRRNMKKFRTKDLLEAVLYMKDSFASICSKISKNKVSIKELYGINGKIERFS